MNATAPLIATTPTENPIPLPTFAPIVNPDEEPNSDDPFDVGVDIGFETDVGGAVELLQTLVEVEKVVNA
jgi:hypothetical protein